MTAPRAPHPVLDKYYPSDGAREAFVTTLFDGAAGHYDRVCRLMSFGSGQWYRERALRHAGLRSGMTLLDVATGTGMIARAAARIIGKRGAVVGLDPSIGMLREARKAVADPLVQGRMETLPLRAERFDFVTIGYALRHTPDLDVAFGECRRVLKPGGRLLVLEISRAPSRATRGVIRWYFMRVLPLIMRLTTRNRHAHILTQYYWDTIAACVPPATILETLRGGGFVEVEHRVLGGCLSEYLAVKPPR